jgi:SPASM domain peptide maturase of grasp-with-spasm system
MKEPENTADRGWLHLHADCKAVLGSIRAAIYDLTRGVLVLIPVQYYHLLQLMQRQPLQDLMTGMASEEQRGALLSFVRFLLDQDLAQLVEDPTLFPAIDEEWRYPGEIQNAIIDVDQFHHDYATVLAQLEDLGCQFVQLRCYSELIGLEEAKAILALLRDGAIESIEMLLRWTPALQEGAITSLLREQPLLSRLVFHGAPEARELVVELAGPEVTHRLARTARWTTRRIDSEQHCGVIAPEMLHAPTVDTFNEARAWNGCLNRKLSIDRHGRICACPSMGTSYGTVASTTLKAVVELEDFRQAWGWAKDAIVVCRGCEFRYVCSDCRAYRSDPGDWLSKPLKCGYDPATGTWSEGTLDPIVPLDLSIYR